MLILMLVVFLFSTHQPDILCTPSGRLTDFTLQTENGRTWLIPQGIQTSITCRN